MRSLGDQIWSWLPDRCEVVDCSRKGVRGNENIMAGRYVCDHCNSRNSNIEFKPSRHYRYWHNPLRWSSEEHDYCWGPFVYSTSDYRPWAVILTSWGGGEDNDKPANLRMSNPWFGTLIIGLPRWMVPGPTITRVYPNDPEWSAPDGEVFKRLGRSYYEEIDANEYGFSISRSGAVGDSSFLQVRMGRSTLDSATDLSWSCFLPWTEWRHVRHSYYGTNGEYICDALPWPNMSKLGGDADEWHKKMDERKAQEESVPTILFRFKDFDGEEIMATTKIEEREWRAGSGWFKWLSWFRKPIIRRSLDIKFSSEVGRRKGSWKGGIIGHSIEMERGPDGQFWEGPTGAFLRYCNKNNLTFVGIGDWPDDVKAELTPKEKT